MHLPLFLIPILVMIISQAMKMPRIYQEKKKITWEDTARYGGFPSSHGAMAASIVTLTALVSGFNSLAFAIAATLAVIIIRDAFGLRRIVGRHASFLNKMLGEKKLEEQVGHSVLEVSAGVVVGIGLTWLFYLAT